MEIDAKTIGTAHPEYAKHLNNLANLLQAMAPADEAGSLYVEALGIFRAKLGPDHPSTKTVEANYAAFLAERDGGASE
ncbi:MAG: tetratricopeptide repeat protein [Limibaculum sp.]